MCGGIPVRQEQLVGSRVLRTRSTVRNAGRFVILRLPAISWIASEPPPTKHPPPTTHHPPTDQPTTAVQQQWNSTYRPMHNGSTAVRQYAPQRYTCGTPEAGWDLQFLTILHLPGDSTSCPRERLFMPPARGVGTRRPFCRWGRLMCGAGGKLSNV